MNKDSEDSIEVVFTFSKEQIERLDTLVVTLGLSTYKELFDHAMTFMHWGVEEVKIGNSIAAINHQDSILNILHLSVFEDALLRAQEKGTFPHNQGDNVIPIKPPNGK